MICNPLDCRTNTGGPRYPLSLYLQIGLFANVNLVLMPNFLPKCAFLLASSVFSVQNRGTYYEAHKNALWGRYYGSLYLFNTNHDNYLRLSSYSQSLFVFDFCRKQKKSKCYSGSFLQPSNLTLDFILTMRKTLKLRCDTRFQCRNAA